MKNKRAQSEVITTVLIILLVIAAVFIVYTAVRGMVTDTTTTATQKSKCIGLTMKVVSANNNTNEVVVQRDAGGDSGKVTPVIVVGGKVVTSATCPIIGELETVKCIAINPVLVNGEKVQAGGKFGTTGGAYTTCEGLSLEVTAGP